MESLTLTSHVAKSQQSRVGNAANSASTIALNSEDTGYLQHTSYQGLAVLNPENRPRRRFINSLFKLIKTIVAKYSNAVKGYQKDTPKDLYHLQVI